MRKLKATGGVSTARAQAVDDIFKCTDEHIVELKRVRASAWIQVMDTAGKVFASNEPSLVKIERSPHPYERRVQTPSTGLRHPSMKEGAGKRCSECGSWPNSKHLFTTSFLQPLPSLVTP